MESRDPGWTLGLETLRGTMQSTQDPTGIAHLGSGTDESSSLDPLEELVDPVVLEKHRAVLPTGSHQPGDRDPLGLQVKLQTMIEDHSFHQFGPCHPPLEQELAFSRTDPDLRCLSGTRLEFTNAGHLPKWIAVKHPTQFRRLETSPIPTMLGVLRRRAGQLDERPPREGGVIDIIGPVPGCRNPKN